jgi:hypothetical protein
MALTDTTSLFAFSAFLWVLRVTETRNEGYERQISEQMRESTLERKKSTTEEQSGIWINRDQSLARHLQ